MARPDRSFSLLLKLGLLASLAAPAFAGQSLVLGGSSQVTLTDPILPGNQSWRIEFQIHNFTLPSNGAISALFNLSGTGAVARLYGDGRVESESLDQFVQQQPCFSDTTGLKDALVRLQRNVQARLFTCEIWNYDGTGYKSQIYNLASLGAPSSSGGTISSGTAAALGFLRVATTLLPLGGKPPTTADSGDWTELKFDGNLRDSSGHNHNGSGSATYMATPNQLAFPYPRTSGAPTWSSWTSLRAGYPAQLDGTASYSLADTSSAVSYVWSQTDGPSTVTWNNSNVAAPTLQGLIFGTYDFSLKVTDAAGNMAAASLQVGAVATDDNGVVINADPNVDRIFGPMIAFGRNPWGYADERAMTATKLRMAAYNAQGLNPPTWATPGPGAATYYFNGVGGAGAAPGTTLASAVAGATDLQIAVTDASRLDLSSFPTRILLGTGFAREEVRICAASAAAGPATLTVCYDGRGQASPADGYRVAAQAWPTGANVGQMKVTGSGTAFLASLCPVGPGPNGSSVYAAGSVRMSAGSSAVMGNSTVWNTANGVIPGYILRVAATHGGVPFVFSAYLASITNATQLTLARRYPSDADSGSFSYSIIQADFREMTLHYTRPADGTDAQTFFQTSGCESDTDAYLYAGHDIASLNGTMQQGKQYGYMGGYGYTSAFGPNFYGEDLAHRALYYRSGWTPALQAARVFGDYFVSSPQLAGGDTGGIPLLIGGGVIGGFAAAVLDTDDPNRPQWSDLRGFARTGSIVGGSGCNDYDTRDSGYLGAWLTLAAQFDPDPVQQADWNVRLAQLFARDQRCKGADNSWSNGFLWNGASAALTVTNGSPVATGTGIPPSLCYGIAGGTMSVTNGSAAAYGTGFVVGNKIVIHGTLNGAPYTGFFQYKLNQDGSITMSALWPGDSGSATWLIENSDNLTAIATSNNDSQLGKNWACTWNSPTQVTLDRPWDGPSETGAHPYSGVLPGYGQQPYMLGIKITQMKLASQIPGLLSVGYSNLAAAAATWIHDTGYDKVTQGLFYGRIMQACEPFTVPPPNSTFGARTPGCNNGLDPASTRAARVLTAEASQALRVYFESNPTPDARNWGDTAYGSIWGYPPYTTGGVYSDVNYVRDENSNASLGAYKWTGFFFGMGMAHQWPAVRLGGVQPIRIRQITLAINQGTANKTRIAVTAPSGKISIFPCASKDSCEVTVDDRQGRHWYRVQYLSADGKIASQSAPALTEALPAATLPKQLVTRRNSLPFPGSAPAADDKSR